MSSALTASQAHGRTEYCINCIKKDASASLRCCNSSQAVTGEGTHQSPGSGCNCIRARLYDLHSLCCRLMRPAWCAACPAAFVCCARVSRSSSSSSNSLAAVAADADADATRHKIVGQCCCCCCCCRLSTPFDVQHLALAFVFHLNRCTVESAFPFVAFPSTFRFFIWLFTQFLIFIEALH